MFEDILYVYLNVGRSEREGGGRQYISVCKIYTGNILETPTNNCSYIPHHTLSLAEQIIILVLLYSCFQYSVFSIGRMELYAFKISFIRFF